MENVTDTGTVEFLLQRIERKDQDALLELYQHYSDQVYSMAIRVLRNSSLAEEVTQDVFVKLWNRPQEWKPSRGRFSTWLNTLTRNASIDKHRSEKRHLLSLPDVSELAQQNGSAAAIADDPLWFDGQVLREILAKLPRRQRDLIEFSYFMGYTQRELAVQLNLPLGTVKSRLRRGLEQLRLLWKEANNLKEERIPGAPSTAELMIHAYAMDALDADERKVVEQAYPTCLNATSILSDFGQLKESLIHSSPQLKAPESIRSAILALCSATS